MSASWLITDGLSGEAGGVNKIVTMGLYSSEEPDPPATPAFNNNIQNWLSPGVHLGILLWVFLHLRANP